MPKLTGRLGTGMTQRGVVRFAWDGSDQAAPDSADVKGLIAARINTLDRSSFQRLSRRLTDRARGILEEAELPSDPERSYLVTTDGSWAPVTADMGVEDSVCLPLTMAVLGCGYPPDSPQGYAAELLVGLENIRRLGRAGKGDEEKALIFAAGGLVAEAGMKGVFEEDFLTDEKVRAGGRKGHRQKYGSEEEKEARQEAFLEAFDAEVAARAGRMAAYAKVARRFGVSESTIRRAVAKRLRPFD